MSLSVDGVWKAGVWATTVWQAGVWREGPYVPPTPTPTVSTSTGGGPSDHLKPFRDYREWVALQEFHREQTKFKKRLAVAVKKKKKAEIKLQFANGQQDLQQWLNALNAAQMDLQALTVAYVEFIQRVRVDAQAKYDEEEREFLELIMEEL